MSMVQSLISEGEAQRARQRILKRAVKLVQEHHAAPRKGKSR